MIRVKGRWKARVEQEFEIEVPDEADIDRALANEMSPHSIVELLDFEHEITSIVDEDEEG